MFPIFGLSFIEVVLSYITEYTVFSDLHLDYNPYRPRAVSFLR